MVSLSSVSEAGGTLYLEIRRIELRGGQTDASYRINGIVGDGCAEAWIKVELGESVMVEIVPICDESDMSETLDERVGAGELKRLVLEALTQVYFCVESAPQRRWPSRVTGYADKGRLYRLHETVVQPHQASRIAEPGPRWQAA
jgi:hypothetical protein